jgi:hypothetical protein
MNSPEIRFDGYVSQMGRIENGLQTIHVAVYRSAPNSAIVKCDHRTLRDHGISIGSYVMGLQRPSELHIVRDNQVVVHYLALTISPLDEEEANRRGLSK